MKSPMARIEPKSAGMGVSPLKDGEGNPGGAYYAGQNDLVRASEISTMADCGIGFGQAKFGSSKVSKQPTNEKKANDGGN